MATKAARAREAAKRAGKRAEQDERERAGSRSAVAEATKRVATLEQRTGLRRFIFENALTLVAFAFFTVSMVGLVLAGRQAYNEDQRQHGQSTVSIAGYLTSGAFMEATGENWESAFLQMGVFVLLTRFLYQRGSSESKRIEEPEAVDQDPREARDDPDAPWPVRRGGMWLALYRNSLSGVTLLMFLLSFALHAAGGANKYNESQRAHGGETVSVLGYIGTGQFWFESFQNWQSEFFSVGVLALLTIWFRQQGSPQSKPVAAPTHDTGE
jgi:uncharacterized protein DUF6766